MSEPKICIIALDPGQNGAIAIRKGGTISAQPLPVSGKTLDLVALAQTITAASPALEGVNSGGDSEGQRRCNCLLPPGIPRCAAGDAGMSETS
jgi:hypothetical protein